MTWFAQAGRGGSEDVLGQLLRSVRIAHTPPEEPVDVPVVTPERALGNSVHTLFLVQSLRK